MIQSFFFVILIYSRIWFYFIFTRRTYCLESSSASSSSSKCATCPLRKWTRHCVGVSYIRITFTVVKDSEPRIYLFYTILLSFLKSLLFFKVQLQSRQLCLSHRLSASTGTNKNQLWQTKKSMHISLLKHTQEEKRNRITADVVLLQLILRDSFSIKEEQEHNLIVVHKHNHPKPEQKHLWSYQ